MVGDPSATHPERNVAPASLHVIITAAPGAHPADGVARVAAALTLALGAIRSALPSLALG